MRSAPLDEDPLIGSILSDRYRVLRPLGRGGFGTVYAALNLSLGTEVAVKVGHRPGQEARILREARAAAGLRSPNTVRVFDMGRLENGAIYIVMEALQGRSLKDYLASEGPLPVSTSARFLSQVCSALREAHAQKLVHRDIKPSNLFVVEGPNIDLYIKLLDFGLAKLVEDAPAIEVTGSDVIVGSPLYMSPEQVRSAQITAQSDIWSLGVVFYEMLSGRLPFERASTSATLVAIAADPPAPLEELLPGLSKDVHAIITRCLRKAPKERFRSVEELQLALSALGASSEEVPRESHTRRSEVTPTDTTTASVLRSVEPSAERPGFRLRPGVFGVAAAAVIAAALWLASTRRAEQYPTPRGPDAASAGELEIPEASGSRAEEPPSRPVQSASPAPSAELSPAPSSAPPAPSLRKPQRGSAAPPPAPSSAPSRSRLVLEPDF